MNSIFLVAPSRSMSPESLRIVRNYLTTNGFNVVSPVKMLRSDLFFSNTDEERYRFLREAFEAPKVNVIWALGGGYGATRLLHFFESSSCPSPKKYFVGFSDATALHLFLNRCWKWPSIHGPTAYQAATGMAGTRGVRELLRGLNNPERMKFDREVVPLNDRALRMETLEGTVVGGNLTLLQCSLGTFWQVEAMGKILLLEEVNEKAYRIDRSLVHLRDVGVFEGVRAILLGDFLRPQENNGKSLMNTVLNRFVEEIPVPVFRIFNVGHGVENLPVLLGTPTRFRIRDREGCEASESFGKTACLREQSSV
ncbi:MAG: LD-carboxypeptidase [Puniceicoccales bacterium]|nr:LD-carboxypeptidase [Puniceicoccales bacterium]